MNIIEMLLLAVGLSMDAFAVAVCKGLAMGKADIKRMCIVGLWFGSFQALMPALGYLLGSTFASYIQSIDHYVSFALLAFIGGNMVKEALTDKGKNEADSSLSFTVMLMMALATSIDALAAGVGFAFMKINVLVTVLFIGIITFILSFIGVKAGSLFGMGCKKKAEICGGVILILLGLKMLLEGILV